MHILQQDTVNDSAAVKNPTTYGDSNCRKGNGVGWISRNESRNHDFTHVLTMQESIKSCVVLGRLCIIQVL